LRRWKDIDLVCRQYDYAGVRSLLISRGFAVDLTIEVATEGRRAFFEGKRFSVDLFVDELEFCHRLPLKQRLSVDPVTIPAADLLLSKLQRVQLRDSDWVDIFLLLGTFALGCKDGITLNSRRLEEVLCSDWGFYYTAICNLKLCTVRLPELLMGNYISAELLDHALLMAGRIVSIIETAPKTIGWKLRSLVGTRLAWYKTVDSPETF
jgi:hypothetical protein